LEIDSIENSGHVYNILIIFLDTPIMFRTLLRLGILSDGLNRKPRARLQFTRTRGRERVVLREREGERKEGSEGGREGGGGENE